MIVYDRDRENLEPGGPSALPERIGIYRVEGLLGSGGMGEVYRAVDDRLKRAVAIKTIRHDAAMTRERRERLRREAQAAAQLSHPAVVQVYDVVFGEDSDAIVMELVEGETMDRLLLRGEVDGRQALRFARQIAEGLAAAHAQGLVHRDLKTENVMVTPAGQAKILDFGLAKEMEAEDGATLTADGALVGTSRAMSPEQARGREVDARSDLFSFGVLCYETFTGRSPFRGDSLLETLQNVVERQPPSPRTLSPELPPELSALIEQLLEKDPERRPASADLVAGALARFADRHDLVLAPPVVQAGDGLSPSPSEALTGSLPAGAHGASRWSRAAGPGTSGGSYAPMRRISARRWLWLAAGLAVLGAAAAYQLSRRPPDISVLIERPSITGTGDAEHLELVATAARATALGTLAALRGISPVEPHRDTPRELRSAARAEAVDQVLATEIVSSGGLCRIVLERLSADGKIEASESLEISTLPQHARELADALRLKLWKLFADHPPPSRALSFEVSDEDYAAFLDLHRQADAGEPPGKADLARLAAALETSPRFLEGQLYAAYLADVLGDASAARRYAGAAVELAPEDDPRPLYRLFRVELGSGRWDEAEALVSRLERRAPGDLLTRTARAKLLQRRGRLEEALAEQRTVVELRPSWQNLYYLADLEYQLGASSDARAHLAALFERSPGNRWGLELEARVEMFYGDLDRAAQIYGELIEANPERAYPHLVNLGLVHYLLGRPALAVDRYRQARELDSRDSQTDQLLRLNLANALLMIGEEDEARSHYQQLVAELDQKETGASLSANESMIRAECLAHLGRAQAAIEVTQKTVTAHPADAQVSYTAALVYALIGDRLHARLYTEKARAGNVQPRWFRIPAFASLAGDPAFEELLR
jgi:serine/threonine-protein kinase